MQEHPVLQSLFEGAQYLGLDGLQLVFQCLPCTSFQFAYLSLLKLIFTLQLWSTFFGGNFSWPYLTYSDS